MTNEEFAAFYRALCDGDAAAAGELVEGHWEALRLVARRLLAGGNAARIFGSEDVCASVFAHFFGKAAGGQLTVESEQALRGLLNRMVIQKSLDKRRSAQHHGGGIPDDYEPVADDPLDRLVKRDLLARVLGLLKPDERRLLELRYLAGHSWAEVAAAAGGTPDAARMACDRIIERVARLLAEGGEL